MEFVSGHTAGLSLEPTLLGTNHGGSVCVYTFECVYVCGATAVKRSILPSAPYGTLSVCQCSRMPQSLPAAMANLHGEGHTGQHMSTWPFVHFETIAVLEGGATDRGNAEDTPHD